MSKQPFLIGGSHHGQDLHREGNYPNVITRVPEIRPREFSFDYDNDMTARARMERYIRFEDRHYGTVYVYEAILDDWMDARFGHDRNKLSLDSSYIFPTLGSSDERLLGLIEQCTAPLSRFQVGMFIYFIIMMAGLPVKKALHTAERWTYKFFKDKARYE